MISKNQTRIESLLGSWTVSSNVKTSIIHYEITTTLVLHITWDSMRVNTCELPACNEIENEFCMKHPTNPTKKSCREIKNVISDWSDISVYMFFETEIVYIEKSKAQSINKLSTGGWIGPYNMILARNEKLTSVDSHSGGIVDYYTTKYVNTPLTKYLKPPLNFTLSSYEKFSALLGADAVKNTISNQCSSDPSSPYKKYLKNCDSGSVLPVLPQIDFVFFAEEDGTERVEVKFDYQMVVSPQKSDSFAHILPLLKPFLPITGPYCVDGNPRRGYGMEFKFDSNEVNPLLTVEHACVEGLPCSPPQIMVQNNDVNPINRKDIIRPVTIEFGNLISLLVSLVITMMLLLLSMIMNMKMWRKQRKRDDVNVNVSTECDDTKSLSQSAEIQEGESLEVKLEESEGLATPLLNHKRSNSIVSI